MKNCKYLFLICLLLTAISLYGQPVKENGQLSVSGSQLINAHNQPVTLRGVSLGWHNWWPRFYNASAIGHLAKDWSCSVVRAAMGVEPDGAYLTRPEWSEQLVCNVVDAAIEEGIYVIIDWHSHGINTEKAKDFFLRMAAKYGKYPNIIYEIFNEPVNQPWEEVKTYSEEIIKAIRAVDKNNIILVGSPHWDTDIHIVSDNPILPPLSHNIMYTLHFYANGHRQDIRDRGDMVLERGVPLFVSECASMHPSGNGELDKKEWQEWISWMEKNRISWVVWSIADKNESCSMFTTEAASEGPWKDSVIKESGLMTREYIQKYNNTKTQKP